MKFSIIIPARYASERFPGKSLADLGGKPVLQYVWEQARKVLPDVWIATDDNRIVEAVRAFGGNSLLTSDQHQSGTDRCAEASRDLDMDGKTADVIINIQGDEPFIQAEQLELLMSCFENDATQIATLANPLNNTNDLLNPNIVKLVRNKDHKAMYFSRSPVPYMRNHEQEKWTGQFPYLRHLGIYAYRYPILQEITRLSPSELEIAESLEQLRWLENGYSIHVAISTNDSLGIDTPEDLERARKKLHA